MKYLILLSVLFLAGCVVDVHSQVDPIGYGMYRVVSQSPSGMSGMGIMMDDARRKAHEFCQESGMQVYIIEEIGMEPPYMAGEFPKAEVHFKCVQ